MSASEAEAVQRLFASVLSKAEAEEEAKMEDSSGWLPLHSVARYAQGPYSIAVFTPIFNAYPSAAKEKQPDGWLPLHLVACHMGGAEGLQAMQLLLKEYPQAAKEKEPGGSLPIHLTCDNENGATLEMVRELLSVYSEGISEEGWGGKKPYARAVAYNYLPAEAIEFLRRAEQGVTTFYSIQSLPLSLEPSPRRLCTLPLLFSSSPLLHVSLVSNLTLDRTLVTALPEHFVLPLYTHPPLSPVDSLPHPHPRTLYLNLTISTLTPSLSNSLTLHISLSLSCLSLSCSGVEGWRLNQTTPPSAASPSSHLQLNPGHVLLFDGTGKGETSFSLSYLFYVPATTFC